MPKRNSQFIKHLDAVLGEMKPAELARKLQVSDSRIPEWMAGKRLPSPDTLIKLGKLALEYKVPDPFFFWALAGHDAQTLRSMATNVVEDWYRAAGETVAIPRFRETKDGREEAGPPVSLPAEFVPNRLATICLLVDDKSTGITHAPNGLFILDTSVEGAEDLSHLWERVVMVRDDTHFTSRGNRLHEVLVGRLHMQERWGGALDPDSISIIGKLKGLTETEPIFEELGAYVEPEGMKGIAYGDDFRGRILRMVEVRERAAGKFRLREGVRILGKVIGRLSGAVKGK